MHVCNERLFLFPKHRQPEGERKALSPRSPSSSGCVLVSESAGKGLPTAPLPSDTTCCQPALSTLVSQPRHRGLTLPHRHMGSGTGGGTLSCRSRAAKAPRFKMQHGANRIPRGERQFETSPKKKNQPTKPIIQKNRAAVFCPRPAKHQVLSEIRRLSR